ncbi:hypothetical protein ACJJTC_015151 [Scirpophaga incertulas]
MQRIMCVTSFFLAIYGVRSYILVTANLDDIQTIAKQLLESSVTEQLSDIWRRASNRYARQLDDQQTRKTNDQEDSDDNKELTPKENGRNNTGTDLKASNINTAAMRTFRTNATTYYLSSVDNM